MAGLDLCEISISLQKEVIMAVAISASNSFWNLLKKCVPMYEVLMTDIKISVESHIIQVFV